LYNCAGRRHLEIICLYNFFLDILYTGEARSYVPLSGKAMWALLRDFCWDGWLDPSTLVTKRSSKSAAAVAVKTQPPDDFWDMGNDDAAYEVRGMGG
jgi:hypothetical protein